MLRGTIFLLNVFVLTRATSMVSENMMMEPHVDEMLLFEPPPATSSSTSGHRFEIKEQIHDLTGFPSRGQDVHSIIHCALMYDTADSSIDMFVYYPAENKCWTLSSSQYPSYIAIVDPGQRTCKVGKMVNTLFPIISIMGAYF